MDVHTGHGLHWSYGSQAGIHINYIATSTQIYLANQHEATCYNIWKKYLYMYEKLYIYEITYGK